MEFAGLAGPGSSNHLLTAAALVNSALEVWGEDDERVVATARNMLQVSSPAAAARIMLGCRGGLPCHEGAVMSCDICYV
jgi:uncharacterized protein (DUF2252 family)